MQTRKTQTRKPYQAILERPGRAPTGMPKLESMPNPKKKWKRTKKQAPKGAESVQARTTSRPAGPTTEQRRKNAAKQNRDEAGKFAENAWGSFWNGLFDPTPKPLTKLKKPRATQARSFSETRTIPPPGRTTHWPAKKRKKPVPERSFFGKIAALYNGDYARWKMQQHRQLARYAAQAQGFDPPRRRRHRRRKAAAARPAPRRPGLFQRLFS
jgi:hypothetical protein